MVNSFDDYLIDLNTYHKISRNEHCMTLLAADCSPWREMAVFVRPFDGEGHLRSSYSLRVYIGFNYIDFEASNATANVTDKFVPIYITLNGDYDHLIDVRAKAFQYPGNADYDQDYDFR